MSSDLTRKLDLFHRLTREQVQAQAAASGNDGNSSRLIATADLDSFLAAQAEMVAQTDGVAPYADQIVDYRGKKTEHNQRQMAAILGVTPSYMNKLEKGVEHGSLDLCFKMAEVLDLKPEEQIRFILGYEMASKKPDSSGN